jgi:hypothetical protein
MDDSPYTRTTISVHLTAPAHLPEGGDALRLAPLRSQIRMSAIKPEKNLPGSKSPLAPVVDPSRRKLYFA